MLKKTKILIADDEKLLRDRLVLLLGDLPEAEVVGTAQNGLEAYEKIVALAPQIVITDIVMPGMSGIELVAQCQRQGLSTRFILLSGHQDFQYAQQAIRFGVASYLLKPIVAEELFATLTEQMNKLRAGPDGTPAAFGPAYSPTVAHLLAEVEKNLDDSQMSLKQICQTRLYINETHAGRLFHKETGIKFSDYVNERRMKQAVSLMYSEPSLNVFQLSEETGFGDNYRYFIEIFKKYQNVTPKQFQLALKHEASAEPRK